MIFHTCNLRHGFVVISNIFVTPRLHYVSGWRCRNVLANQRQPCGGHVANARSVLDITVILLTYRRTVKIFEVCFVNLKYESF